MSKYDLDDTEYLRRRNNEARKFQEFLDKIRAEDKKNEK